MTIAAVMFDEDGSSALDRGLIHCAAKDSYRWRNFQRLNICGDRFDLFHWDLLLALHRLVQAVLNLPPQRLHLSIPGQRKRFLHTQERQHSLGCTKRGIAEVVVSLSVGMAVAMATMTA